MIIKVLPAQFLYDFARVIAYLGYLILAKQRRIALESLGLAFGQEKSRQEIEKIARDCFVYMAKSAAELIFMLDRPSLLKSRLQLIHKENLDSALSKGKGVILVSAHFGNFPLLLRRLSLEGYQTAGIMRPMRDSQLEKLFLNQRNKFRIKTIYSQPRQACVENSIRSLRNNEILFILLDQNFGTGGIFVNFFGRMAATATGPVVLAQRTGAEIIPCFILRQPDDTHEIIFEPPLILEKAKDSRETIVLNIQRLTDMIESYIRRYPVEWGWIHRRWKSRPS